MKETGSRDSDLPASGAQDGREDHPQVSDIPAIPPRRERRSTAHLQIGWWVLFLVIFFGLGLGTGYLVWGSAPQSKSETTSAGQSGADAVDPTAPRKVTRYPVTADDDPSYGPADAPVTIIEFSDFECPYCQRWHAEVWSQLKEAYPDQIRLVYRDFPLYSIHPNAGQAAEAANCAGDQGQYWEFHDLLLSGGNPLGTATYQTYANSLSLDMEQFNDCVESRKYESEVDADYQYAAGIGIQSTPTFFINGVALIGAQPFEVFQELIDLELAGLLTE
jgi:protein-disulfide isomerase